ncbi:helix-turn-helix domain-containing protein [Altererythrobacter lauratis]|uniref:Helix-turn-helix domain-containing protein n=1 Tax=Alteraurantiacibacter lauratis TaxID=2054627 RepID=A0ABV7EEU6_9SPHN
MTEQIEMPEESLLPKGAGAQLRLAREKMGLSIAQMAERTRIPQRQIMAIEAGNLSALPGRAYAVGFARTMARESGLDEEAIVAAVRVELDQLGPTERDQRQTYEPGDPARAPSARLVWISAIAVLVLLVGLFMAARVLFAPAAQLPSLVEEHEEAGQSTGTDAVAPAAPDPSGAVTFTAKDTVWVRFSNSDGTRLMEGELAAGQSYTLPADASGPRILTGRPDLLEVTIAGQAVPPLSTLPQTVSNVPVDAASLLARTAAPAASASPAAIPPGAQGAASRRPAAAAAPTRAGTATTVPADTPTASPEIAPAPERDADGTPESPVQ